MHVKHLRDVMGILSENGRLIVTVAVIVALLVLAVVLVWNGVDLAPMWTFLAGD